jgi:hypothetical protein
MFVVSFNTAREALKWCKAIPCASLKGTFVGIFSIFSGAPKKFVTHEAFEKNLSGQMAMSPQTVAQLRDLNVTPESELKLEFFFLHKHSREGGCIGFRSL